MPSARLARPYTSRGRKELDMVPTGGCYYRIANPMPRVEIDILQPVQKGLLRQGAYLTRPDPGSAQEMVRRVPPNIPLQLQPLFIRPCGVSVFPEVMVDILQYVPKLIFMHRSSVLTRYLHVQTHPDNQPLVHSIHIRRGSCILLDLMESLQCGDTAVEWWNTQRMWLMRRTTSYLLAAIDTIGGMLGISESGFELTMKVDESQAMERYKKGKMEFGPISGMFVIITTISLFNLACLVLGLGRVLLREGAAGLGPLFLQAVLCVAIVPYISSGSCVGQVPHRTGHLSLKLRQRSGARGFGYMKNSKEDDDVLIEQLPELAISL
ncbi:Cellulose synthase-like protein E2 [Hordeum vulgare]|nr:Cellulose synthase-like protein E2 [Hordeum vulgare]